MHPKKWKQKYYHLALEQWHDLVLTLRQCGAKVITEMAQFGLPDMCFTANHAFVLDRKALPSHFSHKERRGEQYFTDYNLFMFKRLNMLDEVFPPPELPFEGQGDCLFQNGTIFLGKGTRTKIGHEHIRAIWPYAIETIRLVDDRFYHLDTCFCPLSKALIYYPDAFENLNMGRLLTFPFERFYALKEKEALGFAANSIEVGENVITPYKGKKFLKFLESIGYNPIYVNLSAFQKAGGAAACLALRIE